MNINQIMGIARFLLSFGSGILVSKGLLTGADAAAGSSLLLEAAGPLVGLGSMIWTLHTNTAKRVVEKAAAIVPVPTIAQLDVGIKKPVTPHK